MADASVLRPAAEDAAAALAAEAKFVRDEPASGGVLLQVPPPQGAHVP